MDVRPLHREPPSGWKFGVLCACRLARGRRLAFLLHATATIFRQEAQQRVHGLEARGVDHGPPLALNGDKSGVAYCVTSNAGPNGDA